MEDQRIRDPIHNLIKFSSNSDDDKILWELIQTPPLQRLRRIKQLGFSEFVYPGATHSRFSHSLGAMQMARRMLGALTKNEVITKDGEFSRWRCATLCAALLHDVGHGPFSHVFEGVSAKLGIKKNHESYTLRIINETKISDILKKGGKNLLEDTLFLLKAEPGKNIYSRIISSQLDADRLDFLCRDKYFSGIHFGQIDLEWLFDSLRVMGVPIEDGSSVEEQTFVISPKGRSVIEEYLFAYSHMYENVYFHKTTRGVEELVSQILFKGLSDKAFRELLSQTNPLVAYFNTGEDPGLDLYLALDDVSVLSLIKYAASGKFGEVSELSRRFLERNLFKCFEIPKKPKENPPGKKIGKFRCRLEAEKIKFCESKTRQKGYEQHEFDGEAPLENILVISKDDGEPTSIAELSPAVKHFSDRPTRRFYFLDDATRNRARKLWKQL